MTGTEESVADSAGTNRRDLLRGAAGMAAAATVGGMMMGSQPAAAAPPAAVAAPQQLAPLAAPTTGLYCEIPNLTSAAGGNAFKIYSAVWSGQSTFSPARTGSVGAGIANLGSLILTKVSDVNSNALVKAMVTGTPLTRATVSYFKNGALVQSFILTTVVVVSLGMKNGGEEPFFEELELAYGEIEFVNAGASPFKWSVIEARVIGA